MFEKYHLAHFDIGRPLRNGPSDGYVTLTDNAPDNQEHSQNERFIWSDYSHQYKDLQNTIYCVEGSFDMLLSLHPLENDVNPLFLQGLSIYESTKNFFFERYDYESILLSYTYEGQGSLRYKDKDFQINKDQLFIIDCRDYHRYQTIGDSWKHIDIHIWGSYADELYSHFEEENIITLSFPEQDFNSLVENLLDAATRFSNHRHLFISNALSNILCTCLYQAQKEGLSTIPDTYKYVTRYMESNYKNPLTLDSLSSFVNISKFHFAKEFKKYTGYSPNEYLIALRIQHACLMLINTDMSIDEIAHEVGIHNMSNFIRQFKKITQMTPSQFRTSQRNIF